METSSATILQNSRPIKGVKLMLSASGGKIQQAR
jgi:hypothetical protein